MFPNDIACENSGPSVISPEVPSRFLLCSQTYSSQLDASCCWWGILSPSAWNTVNPLDINRIEVHAGTRTLTLAWFLMEVKDMSRSKFVQAVVILCLLTNTNAESSMKREEERFPSLDWFVAQLDKNPDLRTLAVRNQIDPRLPTLVEAIDIRANLSSYRPLGASQSNFYGFGGSSALAFGVSLNVPAMIKELITGHREKEKLRILREAEYLAAKSHLLQYLSDLYFQRLSKVYELRALVDNLRILEETETAGLKQASGPLLSGSQDAPKTQISAAKYGIGQRNLEILRLEQQLFSVVGQCGSDISEERLDRIGNVGKPAVLAMGTAPPLSEDPHEAEPRETLDDIVADIERQLPGKTTGTALGGEPKGEVKFRRRTAETIEIYAYVQLPNDRVNIIVSAYGKDQMLLCAMNQEATMVYRGYTFSQDCTDRGAIDHITVTATNENGKRIASFRSDFEKS